jgi:hypothetical protein
MNSPSSNGFRCSDYVSTEEKDEFLKAAVLEHFNNLSRGS